MTRIRQRIGIVCVGIALLLGRGGEALAEDAQGVSGRLLANAAGSFILYLNSHKIASSETTSRGVATTDLTLKAGDVIRAQAIYPGGGNGGGFGMIFVSDDERVILCTDKARWLQYEPKDGQRWWVMDPPTVDTWQAYRAVQQTNLTELQHQAGVGCTMSIWGAWNDKTVHLFRVVTAEDLKPQ